MRSLFNLFFSTCASSTRWKKDTLDTAVDFCVVEGWSLVRSARLLQPFLKCPKRSLF
ncbi:unnamed protein product [Chondrus crispus]|uniref:Uncharacterized protein n=1 Tax=Chondrus crispus TaxID=2769 RepID=R7QSH7_CHOCR|nr:unnamed protein product [Chondrus crispus]CDF40698.1 unnamed protein product [Chondrus crispus]|eukprot:XP_005710992.1 unnamed protein product [Chondrus crispus]